MTDNQCHLAADHMPELEHWQTVLVYRPSWGEGSKRDTWLAWAVDGLKPWHVWRYAYEPPGAELMARAEAKRDELGAVAMAGNGYYVSREHRLKVEGE